MSYNKTKNPQNKVKNDQHSFLKNNPTMDQDYLYAASCQDTTGLTPTVAHNEYEAENYQELNHYLPPVSSTTTNARASDGIHAEMRTKVKPQNECKRDK